MNNEKLMTWKTKEKQKKQKINKLLTSEMRTKYLSNCEENRQVWKKNNEATHQLKVMFLGKTKVVKCLGRKL